MEGAQRGGVRPGRPVPRGLVPAQLPTAEEIQSRLGLAGGDEKLQLAIEAAEAILDFPIEPRQAIVANILLGRDEIELDHLPVRNLVVQDADPAHYEVEEDHGLLFTALPLRTYTITYDVGYERGSVPAVIKELVEGLIRGESRETLQPTH